MGRITRLAGTTGLVLGLLEAALLWGEPREEASPPLVTANPWLAAGPVQVPPPAFLEEEPAAWAVKEPFLHEDTILPEAGMPAAVTGVEKTAFRARACAPDGLLDVSVKEQGKQAAAGLAVAYLAGYLETPCRATWKFEVRAEGTALALFCDGERLGVREKGLEAGGGKPALSVEADLAAGKHVLLLKTARDMKSEGPPWRVGLVIRGAAGSAGATPPAWSIDPTRTLARIEEYRRFQRVGGLALSPDGRRVAIQRTRQLPAALTWIEIRDAEDGRLEQTLRVGRNTTAPRWFPDGKELAFRSGSDLLAFDVERRTIREILRDVNGLRSYFLGPEGRSVYFFTREKNPAPGPYRRLTDPRERLTDWDETIRLHAVSRCGRHRRTLTESGAFSVTAAAPSPDGGRLAFVRRVPIPERPFFRSEFWVLDLKTGKTRCVNTLRFPFENGPANLAWSPEGGRLAFTGPPAEVSSPGAGPEHNAFDTCLWVLDLETGKATRLSDRFDETVAGGPWWRPADGKLYFIAQHHAFRRIACIDPAGTGGLEFLATAPELPTVVEAMAPARAEGRLAFYGSSLLHPVRVYVLDLEGGAARPVLDPNAELMKQVRLGSFERFDFTNTEGDPIDGWIFYPPAFDPERRWPLVVYYYGGVSPREERFSMLTYHWLPANGYVLYVVNPSGAVGQGRAFADKHVNDWGERAGRDIVEGVKRVLAAKPFVDPERIGCYGGSYGGFMTLHLAVTTDLFRACVSMYGIADIASYWGAGIWGYTYGDTALGGSYPWTRPDLFAGRSPLYHADKAHGAVLLLHGTSDVNVPSGESEQMFTALKVLGKDAAYVRFKGEGHGLGGNTDNLLTHRSMILEWFDKYLKDRPEGWKRRWEGAPGKREHRP